MGRYSSHAASAPPSERVLLAVPFTEKDEVKRCGAKWDPVLRTWWISYWDAVDNPGIYRWIQCPRMAEMVKEAYDFINYGANPPKRKKGKHPAGKRPKEARRGPQRAAAQLGKT